MDEKKEAARMAGIRVSREECRAAILGYLGRGERTKAALFAYLERHFGTDRTPGRRDDNDLRTVAGALLCSLLEAREIRRTEGGKYVRESAPGMSAEELRPVLYERIHRRGGPFFERYVEEVLERYYEATGRKVMYAEVCGGSEDGGLDIEIETVDTLGFSELVMVQTKCRSERVHTTEKEVREFYGALTASAGTRGIFVTLGYFHPGAERFLGTVNNCVGLDGDGLYRLILQTGYGIRKREDGYAVDAAILGEADEKAP